MTKDLLPTLITAALAAAPAIAVGVMTSVSAQVANHGADIASLQKAFGDLVGIIARGFPAPTTTVVPPGNPYLPSNALHKPALGGGLFGLGNSLLSPPEKPPSIFDGLFDPEPPTKIK